MPANSLYGDIDPMMVSNSNILLQQPAPHPSIEDTRALSLALEMMHNDNLINTFGVMNTYDDPTLLATMTDAERANKRSQNMTECVAVPSSEHVAEIVGRQGCKIKALRAKTNTYIKTPVRGEEPVFVVTGRKEDVANAKREILSAADHFSQIRACRKNNLNGSMAPGPPTNVPGQITISVRVPYRVVGLVVGPKGATIKRIQQQTTTYIVTPSRDKEPVFEVTGMPESVEAAKKEIEAHIAMRTGTLFDDENLANFAATHNISIESLVNNPDVINYFRSQPSMSSGVSTASLNALLSTTSNHGLGQSLSSNGLCGALSSSSQLGLSNGHSTGMQTSFTNGFSGIGSSNNLATDSTIASLFVPRTSNSLLSSNNLSLSDFGISSLANGLGGANTYISNFDLNSGGQHTSVPSTHLGEGTSSFSLLGEAANNLLNSKGIGSIDHSRAAALFAANLCNRSGQPQPKYCLDEGFNSLSSSMGSSPALDQPQQTHAANIWSDTRYPASSLGLNFPTHHHFASGSNTPAMRQSPTHHLSHSPARRSNSDPSHIQEMCSVFSKLNANAALARSSSTSPELLDFSSALPNSLVSSACSSLFQGASSSARTSPITTAAAIAAASIAAATAAEEASDCLANLTQVSSSFAGTTATTSTTEVPFSSSAIASGLMINGGGSRRGSFDLTVVNDGDASKGPKECWSCHTTQVDGVFIPCGHNHYCLTCATKINEREPKCPSCQGKIDNVFQIRH